MYSKLFKALNSAIESGKPISKETALSILTLPSQKLPYAMGLANELKLKWFGTKTHNCSITNVKSGACSEDCAFCAQSVKYGTDIPVYKMKRADTILEEYDEVSKHPVDRFSVVAAAEGLKGKDIDTIVDVLKSGEKNGTHWCASLGILSDEELTKLKDAGLTRYHHNLEAAKSYFPKICSTHDYELRLDTVRRVKKAGMTICCGGILGIGESLEQRYELAKTVYDEGVDSIPLNFHVPIAGTPLEHIETMSPTEILRSIVMFRFVNPKAEIKIAAGRVHLRDLQSMVFMAGATGIMVGEFLTTAGRAVADDVQMLRDLELDIVGESDE
jgi:biotin synthase